MTMRRFHKALIAVGLTGLMTSAALAVQGDRLSGSEIEQIVKGKRIYLATPFGGEFPLNYRTNGVVDGDGQALGLGRIARPKDEGRWWIQGNQLCQQWQTWYEGKRQCFDLGRGSGAKLYWLRNDGLSGEARIAN